MPDVVVSGPFFSPGEPFVTAAYLHKGQAEIAAETERRVHVLQHVHFKHPTGFYERHITNQDRVSEHLISDSDVVYGPWLEGVGSRNYPHTRFKGYAIVRRTTQEMQDRGMVIMDRTVRDLCEVLN